LTKSSANGLPFGIRNVVVLDFEPQFKRIAY
jgi:hypothetical protein